jgi:hypothetical protein
MKTELNPSQQDYDDKFKNIASAPDNIAFGDQAETQARQQESGDNFSYTGDGLRENLLNQEKGETNNIQGDKAENGLYNPRSQSRSKLATRINNAADSLKKSSNKKKIIAATAGLGGVGLIAGIILMMFMVISGFGVKHVAEVMNIANYSALHTVSTRRTAQYFTEKSMNPNAAGYKIGKQGSRFSKFNPSKLMANLREDGILEYNMKEGTKKGFFTGREINVSELESIKFGDDIVKLPKRTNNPIKWLSEYREQKEFVRGIGNAVESSNLFAENSRLYRTRVVNKVLDSNEIKLFRWTEKGRKVKTFKDALMSLYDRLNEGIGKFKGTNTDVSDAGEGLRDDVARAAENGATSGDEAGREAVEAAVKKVKPNAAKAFAGKASVAVIALTTYCTARDYVNATQANAKEKVPAYKKSAGQRDSASAQIEPGHTTATATSNEAKIVDGSQRSRKWQEDIGNPQASEFPLDIDKSEAPVPDDDSKLYHFLNGVRAAGDAALFVVPDSVKDPLCRGVNSTAGQVGLAVSENLIVAILAAGSGGGAAAGEEGAIAALKSGVQQLFTREGFTQIGSGFAKGTAFDLGLFLTIDLGLKMVLNQEANTATNPPPKAYAKSSIGAGLIKNEIMQGLGGRELETKEVGELNKIVEDKRIAQLHKKPLLQRLASLGDPFSPASQSFATLPYSFSSLKEKSLAFISGQSMNPLQTIAQNSSRLAYSAFGGGSVLAAAGGGTTMEQLGIPTIGWSAAELEKMLEPTYWPLANSEYVEEHESEFADVKDCFTLMKDTVEPTCDGSKLSTESAFRYRLYQLDGGNASEDGSDSDFNDGLLGGLIDAQEITEPGESTTDSTPVVDGSVKDLAQQLLNNPNVTYPYTDSKGMNVRTVLAGVALNGMGLVNSPDVSFKEVAVSPKMLQALVEYAKDNKIGLNALTNADHSSTSNHYKGIAIDIACSPGLNRSVFETIAAKYGGKNNGEVCPGDRHWHYDFK